MNRPGTQLVAATVAFAVLFACGVALASDATPDPGAVAAVKHYVTALAQNRADAAYALLTPSQQHYFGNARNFASNYASTGYSIQRWSVASTVVHTPALVEVDVDQTASFFDVASGKQANARVTEPYFALRSGTGWGVKEIYVPWKSYAPKTEGRAGGLAVVINRVEFYDRRVQVDVTLRDVGSKPVQVLPLLKSRLTLGDSAVAALSDADFPLNDRTLYDGVRLYPLHQVVGYVNFPLVSRTDRSYTARLTIGPVVEDGAAGPIEVTIGPIALPKL